MSANTEVQDSKGCTGFEGFSQTKLDLLRKINEEKIIKQLDNYLSQNHNKILDWSDSKSTYSIRCFNLRNIKPMVLSDLSENQQKSWNEINSSSAYVYFLEVEVLEHSIITTQNPCFVKYLYGFRYYDIKRNDMFIWNDHEWKESMFGSIGILMKLLEECIT